MPSLVGAFKVVSNGNGGIILTGDMLAGAPVTTVKTYAGAGSFETGDLPITNVAFNLTFTNDPDVIDSSNQKTATGT